MGVIGSPFGPPVVAPIGSPFRHPAQDGFRKLLSLYRILSDGRIDLQGWTDSRAADILVKDHEGIYRTIPGGMVAIEGARVVHNFSPIDFSDAKYRALYGATKTVLLGAGPSGEDVAEIFFPDEVAQFDCESTSTVGGDVVISFLIRIVSNHTQFRLRVGPYYFTCTGNGQWQRFSFAHSVTPSQTARSIHCAAGETDVTIQVCRPQIEIKTGASDKLLPSEYIPVLADGTPDDGLAYYATQNGNTVDPATGIVTEAKGADLPGPFYAVHEPASTNQLEYSTEIENWSSNTRVIIEITDDFLGEFRARKIIPTTEDNAHVAQDHSAIDAVGYYTFWCIAEAAGEDVFVLDVHDSIFGTGAQCTFDLSAKTALPAGSNASGGIEEIKPGIFYCWYTVEATATGTNYYSIFPRTTGAYAGDGISGVKVYHCQMEHLAFPTSPIITSGASVSRDKCTSDHDKAGYFNDNEGMLIYDVVYDIDSATAAGGSYSVRLFGDYEYILYANNNTKGHVVYDGVSVSSIYVDWNIGDLLRFYVRWNKNKNEKQIGVSINDGPWAHSSVSTYDGGFGGQPVLRMGNVINRNFKVKQLHVYNKDKGLSFIEANY